MHDIAAIRKDKEAWVAPLKRRPAYADSAELLANNILAQDAALRDLLTRLQGAQQRRNEASKLIGRAKGEESADALSGTTVSIRVFQDSYSNR